MLCPFCTDDKSKVIDSRLDASSNQIKRRRECSQCNGRFTTYERVELSLPRVIKRDGRALAFDENKLKNGLMKALEKRPVDSDTIDRMVGDCLNRIQRNGEREITTERIGQYLLDALKSVDSVAYIRFSSVHLGFQNIDAFRQLISSLEQSHRLTEDLS